MRTASLIVAVLILLVLPAFPFAQEEEDQKWDGPRFELEDLQGDELSEKDVFSDGTLFLIDFWASWCKPCSQYLPHLEEMVEEYGHRGFKVVIFCVDDAGSITSARAALEVKDYSFTILFDPEADVQDALGVRRIPTTVLLDPTGKELWRHVGYSSGDEEEVRDQIEAILPAEEEECGEPRDAD
jgi:thiol-disulfide isomerase/thioredoxin